MENDETKRRFEEQALPLMASLYPAALRLTKQRCDAEDLIQETFTRAYLKFHQYTPGTNLRGWLGRILVTTFYSMCRRRGRAPAEVLAASGFDPADDGAQGFGQPHRSAESEAIDNLAGSFVMRALSELPPQYKAAIYLADIHGYQSQEIAQMLGTPLGTVSSRIHRGRQMLRARIGRGFSPPRKPRVPAHSHG